MQMVSTNCPACGGRYGGSITSRYVTCEYCGSRFALSAEELAALGFGEQDSSKRADDESSKDEGRKSDRYAGNNDPMPVFAQRACKKFLRGKDVDEESFESSRKITNGLGVGADEVYLIHDDTMFKSGKNGFAITDAGIYCRELGDRRATFTSWADFATREAPQIDDCYIRQRGTGLCYFTDNNHTLGRELYDLYMELYEHARQVEQ